MVLFESEERKIYKGKLEKYRQDGIVKLPKVNFGSIIVAGKRCEEAAQWLKKELIGANKAKEIKKHFECQEKFDVLIYSEEE